MSDLTMRIGRSHAAVVASVSLGETDPGTSRPMATVPDVPRSQPLPIGRASTRGASVFAARAIASREPSELAKEELRAYALVGGKLTQIPFREGFRFSAVRPAGAYQEVKAEAVDAAYDAALAERKRQLRDLANAPSAPSMCPEDGMGDIAAFHMSFGAMDQAMERFIEQMAAIGRVEAFNVVVRTDPRLVDDLKASIDRRDRRNVLCVPSAHFGDIWTEDAGEMHRDRSVGVSAPGIPLDELQSALYADRIRRYYPGASLPDPLTLEQIRELLPRLWPEASFPTLGVTDSRDAQRGMVSVAVASGQEARVNFGAVEGGNMLAGTLPSGEVYALIGRDSWVATRLVLERDLGRKVSDDEIRVALSKDYGLRPENVYAIEQPGDYHLDVKTLPIAPGKILVNDALEAIGAVERRARADHAKAEPRLRRGAGAAAQDRYQSDHQGWVDDGQHLEEVLAKARLKAECQSRGEARTVADLEEAGFTVVRAAAVFPWVASSPSMNFINAEHGSGPDGRRFYVALGGLPDAERDFAAKLAGFGVGYGRIYFLDPELTHATLYAGGGISCRAKVELAVA